MSEGEWRHGKTSRGNMPLKNNLLGFVSAVFVSQVQFLRFHPSPIHELSRVVHPIAMFNRDVENSAHDAQRAIEPGDNLASLAQW